MTVPEDHFRLYAHIAPDITAGDYRFEATQPLTATDDDGAVQPGDLPVDRLRMHVRVRSPRFTLSPDQVLSVFPPATTSGAYGTRLPQVVIKRRTLPWERDLEGGDDVPGVGEDRQMPWMALVVVADDEATLHPSVPVADTTTSGVELEGPADVANAACLEIRTSAVRRLFPARVELPFLAHAREVDIADTELLMGDDDGYMAVVVANRLPLPARATDGTDLPRRYTACLVNLEGQLHQLREFGPDLDPVSSGGSIIIGAIEHEVLTPEEYERAISGLPQVARPDGGVPRPGFGPEDGPVDPIGPPPLDDAATDPVDPVDPLDPVGPLAEGEATIARSYSVEGSGTQAAHVAGAGYHVTRAVVDDDRVGLFAGRDRTLLGDDQTVEVVDPTLRFPVLLHWSFTSTDDTDFESLMSGLDSALIGSTPARPEDRSTEGRPPLEVVGTGHVGLTQRTRDGDVARAWYRGPLVPHPQAEEAADRLPLAHDADQLRVAIPDGREDLSLASAFEIGRLLAMSRPAMVSSLLRWRRRHFAEAHGRVVGGLNRDLADLLGAGLLDAAVIAELPGMLRRRIAEIIAVTPEEVLGAPVDVHPPGVRPGLGGDPGSVIAAGFGLDPAVFGRDLPTTLEGLAGTPVRTGGVQALPEDLPALRDLLHLDLDDEVVRLASDTLGPVFQVESAIDLGPTVPGVLLPGVALDELVRDGRLVDGVLDRVVDRIVTDDLSGGVLGPGLGDRIIGEGTGGPGDIGPFGDPLDRLLGEDPPTGEDGPTPPGEAHDDGGGR